MKNQNLTETIHVKVTPEQRKLYTRLAQKDECTLSSWIRYMINKSLNNND